MAKQGKKDVCRRLHGGIYIYRHVDSMSVAGSSLEVSDVSSLDCDRPNHVRNRVAAIYTTFRTVLEKDVVLGSIPRTSGIMSLFLIERKPVRY